MNKTLIDKKITYFLLGRAMFALTVTLLLPILYALSIQKYEYIIIFGAVLSVSLIISLVLTYYGKDHRNRVQVGESAFVIILIWIFPALVGAIPFVAMQCLSPIDAILETVSDLTSASVSFLPAQSPYILILWQSALMWVGSFIFLSMLVTILPEVSGCFGMELSLSQGQIFSPMIGQMRYMARKILIIYELLTLVSIELFRLAGLDNWNAVAMAMRCISTGGGKFFIEESNLYVEYAAIFSMLLACGNFLLYFRLLNTLIPPTSSLHLKRPIKISNFARRIRLLLLEFIVLLRRNMISNLKIFFSNSEVQFFNSAVAVGTLLVCFSIFSKDYITDGNESFRLALFHVVSYLSTTGITITDLSKAPDFNRFFVFMLAIIGGCMGSVAGGLKIIRIIVLFKLASIEILKTLHPRMVTNIKISGTAVPMKTVGRILSYFFLCSVSLFIFAVILSLSGQPFSTSVAMSVACLTSVGPLPGICDSEVFMALPAIMKLVCCLILIVGRMEIFALLILIALVRFNKEQHQW